MIKISKKYSIIGAALLIAVLLAFFPTSSFIASQFTVDAQLKQQHYNEAGIFTITPFEAANYYSFNQNKCFWIDLRSANDFSKSHLKPAVNQTLKGLQNTRWNPDDLIIVYGNSTIQAQEAVAYLRQVANARAFAVKGGFKAVQKFLMNPIDISVTNQLSDKQLQDLVELRNKISGENVSPAQVMKKLKSSKSASVREGC